MATATEAWENFFSACDIPSRVREKYAKRFVKERIQPYLLKELGKDELRELGIDAVGDQLAIIRYVKQCKGCPPEFVQVGKSRVGDVHSSDDGEEDEEDEEMEIDQKIVASKVVNKNYEAIREINEKQKPPKRNILGNGGGASISTRVTGVGRGGAVRDLDRPPTTISVTGISAQSKLIRKQPTTSVQIPQITSSEPPIGGSRMRSDLIPGKTTIIASPQRVKTASVDAVIPPESRRITTRNPDFLVRLNMPQSPVKAALAAPRRAVAYDTDLFLEAEDAETEEPLLDDETDGRLQQRSRVTLNERISGRIGGSRALKSASGSGPLILRPRSLGPAISTVVAAAGASTAKRRVPVITFGGQRAMGRRATVGGIGGRRRSLAAQAIAQAVPVQMARASILDRISVAR